MTLLRLLLLSGALCLALPCLAAAQTQDLRARLETVLRTSTSLKVPANIDRACVIDQAVLAHPGISRGFDSKVMGLVTPKAKRAEVAQSLAGVKDTLAVGAGINACNPKPAKGAKPAR